MQDRKVLYIMGWCLIGGVGIWVLVGNFFGIPFKIKWPPCLFHLLTGYYCPGCGGIRSVMALLRGDIRKSIICHPVVPYMALLFVWFMATSSVEFLSRGRLKVGMKFRKRHVILALSLTALHFIAANGALLLFGVDLLKL